jgi:hypothetical protein
MTVRTHIARYVGPLLLIACGRALEKKMDKDEPLLETSIPGATVDVAGVSSLRLVAEPEGPRLAYSITRGSSNPVLRSVTVVMSRAAGSRTDTPLVEFLQLLPPPPAWDVARLPSGGYELVHELAGGALTALTLRRTPPDGDEQAVSGHHPMESFARPRFVRDVEPPAPVLAENNGDIIVFMRPDFGQSFSAYHRIVAGERPVGLHTAGGYLLFYKSRVPGPVRGVDIDPGVLQLVALSKDFVPNGEPVRPLGDRTIYELDAATGGGRVLVVVTTPSGAALLGGASDGREMTVLREFSRDGPLSSPAIVRDGEGLAMAFIEDAGTKLAHFLHVSMRLH